MTSTLADQAREGRRAALAALNARTANCRNVVSIFNGLVLPRQTVPLFHSTRAAVAGNGDAGSRPLLTRRIAA